MEIILKGYFDNNFGDDYMILTVVRSLPEYKFILTVKNEYTGFILREPNVFYKKKPERGLPVLMIVGNGFMINSRLALMYEIQWFLTRKHIADYCVGCNIERLDTRLKKFLIKTKLSKFRMIVCRDKKSFEWLNENLKKTKVYYLPDILFSSPLIPDSTLPAPDKLGISLFHRSGDTADCEYYKKMAEAADYYIEKTGKSVILTAFDSGTENDIFACESVKSLMRHGDKASIVAHGQNGEIINAMRECEKVIGARFHSVVLSMKMGIDFFPIICRDKMRNLLEDAGYTKNGCGIDNLSDEELKKFLDSEKTDPKTYCDPKSLPTEYIKLLKSQFE